MSDADDDEREEEERHLIEEDGNTDADSQVSPGPERAGVRDRRRRNEEAGERDDYVQHMRE